MGESLHKSYYTIPVKLQAEDDKHMLIHGYTGAIDIVDSNIVNAMNAGNISSVLSEDEISLLSQRGYLTNKTVEEEQSYVAHFADVLHRMNSKLYKNFGFVITYDCNFRCPYCFENAISNNGKAWSKQRMTKELVDRAFDAMTEIEPRRELHRKEILLYGGEPLLRENYDIVKYIVEKGTLLGYVFRAITNGYDLAYYNDILGPDKIYSLQISIDGFRDNHNKNKYHYIEGKSFDKVMSNIGIALKNNVNISVRINLDCKSINDLNKLKEYFDEQGFTNHPHFYTYAAKIDFNNSNSNRREIKYLNNRQFANGIDQSTSGIEDIRRSSIIKTFKSYFANKSKIQFTPVGCSGQYGTHMFGPDSGIYTCFETIGKKEHCIGYYNKPKIEWTKARNLWFSKHVGNSSHCKYCRYALLCGGNCAIKEFSSPTNNICTNFKELFEEAVNEAYLTYITQETL
ncbi:radical SAM protein [uncultured Muribaculum sp.]|uniref:radical SAM/SPASM domain-containing protein n=1 Tax=uncultured Muribaculum sp. TaxID=1918613 RepID=UPI00267071B1|nr:radical SAM protein [uncultured Muribaculum sp.]